MEIGTSLIGESHWLIGKFLDSLFGNGPNQLYWRIECDSLQNGSSRIYFPSISLQYSGIPSTCCELVFSPEDIQDCLFPNCDKPLLLSKLIQIENSMVNYSFSAYIIGGDQEDFFFLHERILQITPSMILFMNVTWKRHLL